MKYHRKFVIKIVTPSDSVITGDSYVKDFIKNTIGYYYTTTHIIENSKFWRYKKTCDNSIKLFLKNFDTTKIRNWENIDDYDFQIIEITDNQTLRSIKLSKLNKNIKL